MPYVTYTISGITRAHGRAQITSNNNNQNKREKQGGVRSNAYHRRPSATSSGEGEGRTHYDQRDRD
jgi:hypothetical protein